LFRENGPVENTENRVEKNRLKTNRAMFFQPFEKIILSVSVFQRLVDESQGQKIIWSVLFHTQYLCEAPQTDTSGKTDP
jgi:hypothetical protein